MTMFRELGMCETYVKSAYENANGTTGVSAVIQLVGPVTAEIIKLSLYLLQMRHPLLRAKFSDSEDSFVIDDQITHVPLDIVMRNDSDQWQQVYHEHLNVAFVRKGGYLWRATYITSDNTDEYELVASFHHTIIDGQSIGVFYRDLLNFAKMIIESQKPQTEQLPLLPNFEAMLKRNITWEQYLAGSEIGFKGLLQIANQLYTYEQDVPLNERKTRYFIKELDKYNLIQLLDKCRQNNTTLTSLMSASLLLAAYGVKGGTEHNRSRIQVAATPVNMRNNCLPAIGPDNLGPYVSLINTVHVTDQNTMVWDLARSFQEEAAQAIEEQCYGPKAIDRQVYLQMMGEMTQGPLAGKYVLGVGVTNYGVIDLPTDYGSFHIQHFYSGAARHAGDWMMLLHTATYNDKISFCFCYEEPLLSIDNAIRIVEEFFKIMDES